MALFVLALAALVAALPVEDTSYLIPHIVDIPQHFQEFQEDSGEIASYAATPEVAFKSVVHVSGASWLKLQFSEDTLLGFGRSRGPFLKLTSLLDGAVQFLDAQSIAEWYYTSAYFNGDAVQVELLSSNGLTGRVKVVGTLVGEGEQGASIASICDGQDKREPCYENKAARYIGSGGCSGWIINDEFNCFLTAGHCGTNAQGSGTMQFNVPLSSNTGSINHPPPEDQFSVDRTSVQSTNGGVGNDWMYLGTFRNSNTDRTAYEHINGTTYNLAASAPASSDSIEIHIAGYGVCETAYPQGACESRTYSQVNKNHTYVGDYTFSGTTIRYRTDTTGGNSGSGVEVVTRAGGAPVSWSAIGVHTHGGCSVTGGSNAGTARQNSGLSNALRSPDGVCAQGPKKHAL